MTDIRHFFLSPYPGKDLRMANDKDERSFIARFLFPKFTAKYFLRIVIIAIVAAVIFSFVARPFYINGGSMMPTYPDRGLIFCDMLTYDYLRTPSRGDIVILEYDGHNAMLLKRVLGFEGEKIEFKKGKLFVDGIPHAEPYVKYPCY